MTNSSIWPKLKHKRGIGQMMVRCRKITRLCLHSCKSDESQWHKDGNQLNENKDNVKSKKKNSNQNNEMKINI